MAHFAKVNDLGVVETVVVVDNLYEDTGQQFLNELGLDGTWLRTSYNTKANTHALGKTPYRYNYAAIGGTFDPSVEPDGAFIPPYPETGEWTLDTSTYTWIEVQ